MSANMSENLSENNKIAFLRTAYNSKYDFIRQKERIIKSPL